MINPEAMSEAQDKFGGRQPVQDTLDGEEQPLEKIEARDYLGFKDVATYFFRKKGTNTTRNINLKMMHGINKISIVVFLLGVLFLIARRFF